MDELKKVSFKNSFVVSYDVVSLFTNIPLDETIELALDLILKNNPNIKITRNDLKKLFIFATSKHNLVLKMKFINKLMVWQWVPLAPVLANLFMGHHEKLWINEFQGNKPRFYRRYVDDIFATFQNASEAENFLNHINNKHQNIKFTMEVEQNKTLAFLDILINFEKDLTTSVYRKKTYTGLLTNYLSFTPFQYKIGLIRTLLDRTYKINNTWQGIMNDFDKLSEILQKNAFPTTLINKIMRNYINEKCTNPLKINKKNEQQTRYFSLPFIGKYSNFTKQKLSKLSKRFCKDITFKIIYKPLKIGTFFSLKDPINVSSRSNVIYKFICAGCNACYIGETTRSLNIRIKEHLRTDKQSKIFQHLSQNLSCFDKCDPSCFSILDQANNNYTLKVKEGLYIEWAKPDLNKQLSYLSSSLTI